MKLNFNFFQYYFLLSTKYTHSETKGRKKCASRIVESDKIYV